MDASASAPASAPALALTPARALRPHSPTPTPTPTRQRAGTSSRVGTFALADVQALAHAHAHAPAPAHALVPALAHALAQSHTHAHAHAHAPANYSFPPLLESFTVSLTRERMMRVHLPVWLALVVIAGCGSGERGSSAAGGNTGDGGPGGTAGNSSGGSAGIAGSGGAGGSTGSGGTGIITPVSDSLRAACREYILAACERREECTAYALVNCVGAMDLCPDYLFSEGSTRTRESVLACAEDYRTQPCDEVIAGKPPACATKGTLPVGSPCVFSNQCASGVCTGQASCGECVTAAEPYGTCSAEVACPVWQECVDTSCVDDPITVNEAQLPGATDCRYSGCTSTHLCARTTPTGEDTCLPKRQPGDVCYYSVIDPGDGSMPTCGPGLYCAADSKCALLPADNQPCAVVPAGDPSCAEDHECVNGTCQTLNNPGENCDASPDICTGETVCRCPTEIYCTVGRTCVYIRGETEPCSATERCVEGTECVQGTCVATDELTLYDTCG